MTERLSESLQAWPGCGPAGQVQCPGRPLNRQSNLTHTDSQTARRPPPPPPPRARPEELRAELHAVGQDQSAGAGGVGTGSAPCSQAGLSGPGSRTSPRNEGQRGGEGSGNKASSEPKQPQDSCLWLPVLPHHCPDHLSSEDLTTRGLSSMWAPEANATLPHSLWWAQHSAGVREPVKT